MTMTDTHKPLTQKASHHKQPPGPSSFQIVKNTLAFQRAPLAFITQLARDYGDICQVQLPIGLVTLLNHPDSIRHVLVEYPRRYDKNNPLFNTARRLGGDGLITASGRLWQKQRHIIQPAFHKQHLAGFGEIMTKSVISWLSRWEVKVNTGQPIEMVSEMQQLGLFLLSKTIFSDLDLGEQLDDLCLAISEFLTFLDQYLRMPFPPIFVPTKKNRCFKQTVHHLDSIIYGFIEERRRQADKRTDLLGLLLAARDEESGEGMSERQLHDELVTFFIAGSETSAKGLAWVFYLLSQHTEVQERLYEEVDRVLVGRLPTSSDLPQLIATRMIIEETLRLYPPAPILMRRSLEEEEIGGYRIASHSLLLYSPYLLHRHPAFWEEPERFWPERFSPEQPKQRYPQTYMPFGAGPRLCIAQHFALMEMTIILAIVASRYRLQLVLGQSIEPAFRMTLTPRNGLYMYVRARDN